MAGFCPWSWWGLARGLPRGRLDLAGSLGVSIVLKRCDAEDIS